MAADGSLPSAIGATDWMVNGLGWEDALAFDRLGRAYGR